MKAILLASAALVLGQIAMAQVTPAVAANVSGKYALSGVTSCEARLADPQHHITGLTGVISANTGYVTFTPSSAGAASGTVVATGVTQVEGGALRFGKDGFAWSTTHDTSPATSYSFTATTFTLGGNVYSMTQANLVGTGVHAVYKTVNILRRRNDGGGNPNCLESTTFTQ